LPELSEALIQRYSSPESFRRGQGYYRQGAVASLILRGQELRAEVAGSQFAPYGVRVVFDAASIIDATCSCPYEWGGLCKHIVAALLAYSHEPESVRELPALEEALSGLEREELKDLVLKLAERYPSLAEAIEGEIALSSCSEPGQINVDAIRRSLRASIQAQGYSEHYDEYWHFSGRRGRHEEYLRLSAAEDTRHAIMLARLDRSDEAVEYASKHLRTPEECLAVAETLRERGDAEAALVVGEKGLWLEGPKSRLAGWVSDLAEGLGR
jgi:uncharacterized Zn finger protein